LILQFALCAAAQANFLNEDFNIRAPTSRDVSVALFSGLHNFEVANMVLLAPKLMVDFIASADCGEALDWEFPHVT
jgi:hypothetical protein